MPVKRKKSVLKRHRQSLAARERNRSVRSGLKSSTKRVTGAAGKAEAAAQLSELKSILDKAVKRNVLHKNTAARRKSRLTKMLNKKQPAK